MNFQEVILNLQQFWADYGCVIWQPTDIEVGAGTFNPATFLRVLGPEPWKAAYVEPCRRPTDGRYGENPFRLQHYYQFQVIIKPSPTDIMNTYLQSLQAIGIDPMAHDIRFVEDDWEAPTLGASGLGWEVWLDGMEITQYTYFQQVGGIELDPITCEMTYGLERLAMYLQDKNSIFDLLWNDEQTYGELHLEDEIQFSKFNFEEANVHFHRQLFDDAEKEAYRLMDKELVLPAYEYAMKCSHAFNIMDARGSVSVTERVAYIGRVRKLAGKCAAGFLGQRETKGFPLLKGGE